MEISDWLVWFVAVASVEVNIISGAKFISRKVCINPEKNTKTKRFLVLLLLQDQIRQHIDVHLFWVTLQHQRHHVVLTWKNLTELLSQAGCFLWIPVFSECRPRNCGSVLLVLVSSVPSPPVPSPFPPAASARLFQTDTRCSITKVQHLRLGTRRFGGWESGGYAGKRVVSWVRGPERRQGA